MCCCTTINQNETLPSDISSRQQNTPCAAQNLSLWNSCTCHLLSCSPPSCKETTYTVPSDTHTQKHISKFPPSAQVLRPALCQLASAVQPSTSIRLNTATHTVSVPKALIWFKHFLPPERPASKAHCLGPKSKEDESYKCCQVLSFSHTRADAPEVSLTWSRHTQTHSSDEQLCVLTASLMHTQRGPAHAQLRKEPACQATGSSMQFLKHTLVV